MTSIEDQLKELHKLSTDFGSAAEALSKEIRKFECELSKLSLPFELSLKISENDLMLWHKERAVLLFVSEGKIIGNLSSASIKNRQKAIELFPEFLQLIADKYKSFLQKDKNHDVSKSTQERTISPAKTAREKQADSAGANGTIQTPVRSRSPKTHKRRSAAKRSNDRAKKDTRTDGV